MDFSEDYMRKILRNLLSNAIKHAPKDTTVTVTTSLSQQDKRHLHSPFTSPSLLSHSPSLILTVTDHGSGIPADEQQHIFEPFYRATTESSLTGTGIGLPLARLCAEAMGGTLTVESTPGAGTTFTLHLPKTNNAIVVGHASQRDTHETATFVQSIRHAGKRDLLSTRLLIVEDAPEVAYYVARLMPRDFVVDFAANGEEALAKAEATVPDIIVTDIMMPGIDGLELCRRVRNNDLLCHIPVVMVTARTSPQDRIDGLQAGADAYLEKPFRSEELSVCVAKLLEQRRLLQMEYSPSSDPSSPTPDPSRGGEGSIYNHRGEVAADVITPLPSAGGAGGGAMVARACGFDDAAYFSRFFRKMTGLSPSEYARKDE